MGRRKPGLPPATHELETATDLTSLAPTDLRWQQALRERLVSWYEAHRRDLPWRKTRDPYAIWISETMLQQTQVATVIPYFERFLQTFPTIADLAAGDEQTVLRLWEGLGYYRRARNLHAAAKKMVAEHGGQFPRDPMLAQKLPGIGRYTAGAILSIAWDDRLPILEANTIRLVSRLIGSADDPRGKIGQERLWGAATDWLPQAAAGTFNQALMELGSLVCTPKAPACLLCPLASLCVACRMGQPTAFPPTTLKPTIEQVRDAAVIVTRGSKVLLVQNGPTSRWAGLWDFLRFTHPAANKTKTPAALQVAVEGSFGVQIEAPEHVQTLKHSVTRYRITLEAYRAAWLADVAGRPVNGSARWVELGELDAVPLSTTGRTLAALAASGPKKR